MNGICLALGHKEESHLDYIYGSLPREHKECMRCGKTISFHRVEGKREEELSHGFIGDGANGGCKPI